MPEIMIPLVGHVQRAARCSAEVDATRRREVMRGRPACEFAYTVGTMIEVPRAALTADEIARERRVLLLRHQRPDADDASACRATTRRASCRATCETRHLRRATRSRSIDQAGVGALMQIAVEKGRRARAAASRSASAASTAAIPTRSRFCHRVGLDYVSCSPYRVPSRGSPRRGGARRPTLADGGR